LTWLALGAWSATALVCATLVNTNPFRGENAPAAEPRHFDPFQLFCWDESGEPEWRRKAEPQPMKIRVSQLKNLFDKGRR
jgi:hypothetical protein